MNGPTPLQLTRSQSLLSHATTEHTKKLNQPPESSFHRLTHQHPSFQSVIKRVADDGFPLNELFNVPTDHCTISYSKHPWSFHHYAWTSSSDTKEIEIESQTTPGLTTDSSVWDPASKCILDFYQQPKAQFHFPYTSHADFHPLSELPTSPSSSSSFPSSLLQTYLDPSFETYLVPQPRSRLFPFTSTPPSPSSPCSSTLPTSWITLDAFTSTFPSLSSPLLEGTIRMAIYDPVSQRKLTPDSDGGVGGRGPVSSPLTAWSIDVLVYPESVLVIRLDRPLLSLPSSSSSSMSMTSSTYFQPWCFHVIPLAQLTWPHPPSIQVTFDTLVLCRPTEPFMTTLTSFLLDPKKRDWKLVPCHGSLHFSKHDDTNNNNNNDKDARDSIPKTPMHPETGGRGGVTLFPWIPPPSTASSFSSPSSAASFRSHVVYVFPKSLLWKKKTSPTQTPTHPPKQKFRNVLCVIEMYNGLKRVPCIYSLTRPHQRLESAHTRVWYHEKNPFFEDEIKMDLPLNPNGHFLKFTFYHVACKPKQAGKLTCFGSSIFFLTSPQGSYTPEGLSTLSVVSNLPQPLTTTLATATDPLVFECEVAYDSALVVTHPSLYALLVHQELPTHLHDLASFYTSSRFPMVVHRCLDLSQEGPTGGTLMLDLFRVLMLWISTASVDDLLGFLNRSILPPPAPHPLHAWRVAVREVTLVDTWEPFVWFLGAWVTRSLALEEGVARDLDPTPFSIVISEISKLVFERSTQYVNKAKQLNNQLAYFIRDLIPFFPFSQIQSWFCLHLHTVTPTSSILDIQLKLDSLWILSGYEHPIPLSYVICQCIPFVFHEVVDIRITSLSLLRNLVCLRISTLPIPLCIYLLETLFPCVPLLSSTKEPSETFFSRTLILCILLLFQRVPDKYLSTWMSGFMEIATWISHLKPLIDMFHYPSDDAVRDRLTIIRQVLHARTAKHHLEERFKDFSPLPTKTKFIKGKDSTSLITSTHIEQENELSNQVMLVVVSILDVLLVSLTHKTFASFMPFILEFLNFRLRPSTLGQLVLRMIKLIDFHPTAVLEFHLDPFLKTIMTYALSLDLELRLLGAQLLANMFQSCFQYHLSTFTLFRIHLTRTIAKLSLTDAHTMHLCLETMQQLQIEKNDKEKDLKSLNFLEEMKTVIESISQVILNRIKLDKILDFESKLACFHQIANGYFNIPDLRLDTLCAMSDLNEAQGRYMEAALSCLHAAALVSEFLLHRFPKRPGSMGAKAFGSCNSNLLEESMTHTLFQQLHFVSPLFSETGLTQLLQRIIALCIQAHLYDLLIPMSKLLFPIYEVKKQWNALAELHLALSNTFQSLTTGSTSKENTGGTYFRVAFLGDMWDEDLKQQVFVYRMDPSYTLPAFSEEMKSTFKFLGDALLIHLGPSDPSEPPKPQTALLHITLLEPLPPSTFNHSTLSVEMIHQFVYLVPFHLDESTSHGTMATQCLRQFQLTTVHPFPYLVNRLPILQTTQETFPPIQVATQVLNARTSMLTSILTNPIEFPKLQRLLHMMFELPEDQAPMHMVHTFLTASVPDSEPRNENVLGLKRALSAFLRQCELGVTVTRQAGPDDKKNIQQELEQKFEALRTALEPHLVSESKVEPKDEEEEKMLKRVEAFLGSTMDLNSFLGSE